jgi:cytochrome oxidase assembly protein ShyY1
LWQTLSWRRKKIISPTQNSTIIRHCDGKYGTKSNLVRKFSNAYILYLFTWFSLSVGSTGPNQKAYRYFQLILLCSLGSIWIRILGTRERTPDPDPGKWCGSLRIRIRNTVTNISNTVLIFKINWFKFS